MATRWSSPIGQLFLFSWRNTHIVATLNFDIMILANLTMAVKDSLSLKTYLNLGNEVEMGFLETYIRWTIK